MEAEELTHRCRAGQVCAARTSDGPALTVKPDTLCHSCIASLQEKLDQLPEIQNALRLFLGGIGGSSAQTKVAGSSEPSVPINLHALDVINEVRAVLFSVNGYSVADLIRHPDDGIRKALSIGRVYKKADGIIGISRRWERRIGACPKCSLRTLGSFSGSDSVQCSNCGAIMSREEYKRITIIRAEGKVES